MFSRKYKAVPSAKLKDKRYWNSEVREDMKCVFSREERMTCGNEVVMQDPTEIKRHHFPSGFC